MITAIPNRLVIRCQQTTDSRKQSKNQPNKKYETFAKKVVDKRKLEVNSIKDSLNDISKNEMSRFNDLLNAHINFFKNDDLEDESKDISIDNIIIKENINDDFFEN